MTLEEKEIVLNETLDASKFVLRQLLGKTIKGVEVETLPQFEHPLRLCESPTKKDVSVTLTFDTGESIQFRAPQGAFHTHLEYLTSKAKED